MSADVAPARAVTLQRGLFAAFVVAALVIQALYLWNVVGWRVEPDRGWYGSGALGPHVIARTRSLGEASGLRRGDRILAINGKTYDSVAELFQVLDLRLGSENVYTIQRGDETLRVPVITQPLGLARVMLESGLYWALGTLFIGLGVLVFLMKPYHGPSWAFLIMASLLGVAMTYAFPSSVRFRPPALTHAYTVAAYVLPAALLHLTCVFPERRRVFVARPWLLALPYLGGLWLAALAVRAPDPRAIAGWLEAARYLNLLLVVVVFLGSTLVTWLRPRTTATGLQALAVFTGSVVALLVPMLDQTFAFLVGQRLFPDFILFTLLFLTFFPLAIGYSIVRHDLFEIDVIVRRTYGYLLSTGLVIALYGSTVSVLNLTVGPSEIARSPFFTVAFVLAVVFLMQPLQRRIQAFVDRAFYRQQYDYRKTITDVSDRMTSLLEPDLVRETLVGSVVNEMFLENGLLLAPEDDSGLMEVLLRAGDAGSGASMGSIQLDKMLWETLSKRRASVFGHEIELAPQYEGYREGMQASFDELQAELMLPMLYQGELRAVLSLGRKKSGKMYTREDVDLLHTLVGQGAVALENARLFDEVAASLKQIQMLETIKSNLAKFVPQTVQSLLEDSDDAEALFEKRDRDLSVMFADMTGYTRLSAQLPVDEVNSIIELYFGAFLDEIIRYGGDVNETAGDGLMVLFQDDDPQKHAQSAVRAALGIQRITKELNAEREGQVPIGMHIGINSGTASVGATKIEGGVGMRWTYTASGPVTILSARIGAIGEDIAITEETRDRLGDGFVVEDIGPQSLKNVSEPVTVYRVTELCESDGVDRSLHA